MLLWKSKVKLDSPVFDLRFSLAITTTILMSYHLYTHDVIILALALILTLSYVLMDRPRTSIARNGFARLLILFYLPLVPFFLEIKGDFAWGVLPIIFFYFALASEIYSLQTSELPMTVARQTAEATNA